MILIIQIIAFTAFSRDNGGSLRFVGSYDIPPITFIQNDEPVGLAVDLAHAVAKKADLSIRVEPMDWPQAQSLVLSGEADALLQINPSPEREKLYDFSETLLESNFHIFRKSLRVEIQGLASLSGKKVGVAQGGFPIQYLKEFDKIETVVIENLNSGFDMLQNEHIDAIMLDRWAGEYELFLHRRKDITIVKPPIVTSYARIAVKKGNKELLDRINFGLKEIERDGTRQKILKKWQAKEVVYVTRESIVKLAILTAIGSIVVLIIIAMRAVARSRQINKINRELIYENQKRKLAEAALQQTNDTLEQNVSNRTADLQTANERLRLVLKASAMGTFEYDLQTGATQWNTAAYELLGIKPDDVPASPESFFTFVHPDDLNLIQTQWQEALRIGNLDAEYRVIRGDGEVRWFCGRGQFIFEGGRAVRFMGVNFDITERKHSEKALRESEERYRSLYDGSIDGIFAVDLQGRFILANPAAERLSGYSAEEFTKLTIADLCASDQLEKTTAAFLEGLAGKPQEIETAIIRKDGARVELLVSGSPVCTNDKITGIFAVASDITERKHSENALRKSESKFRVLFECSPDCVFLTCPDGSINAANPTACAMFGRTEQELCRLKRSDILNAADPRLEQSLQERRQTGLVKARELTAIGKDGSTFPVEVDSCVMPDDPNQSFVVMRDITERKQAQEKLRESEERARNKAAQLQTVLDAAPVIIWIASDPDCRHITGNREAVEFSRVSAGTNMSKTGETPEKLTHYRIFRNGKELAPEEMPIQIVARTGQELREYALEFHFDDGEVRSLVGDIVPMLDSQGRPNGVIAAFIDITDRKRAEDLSRQTLQALPAHIAVIDRKGRIIAVNQAWMEFARGNGADGSPAVAVGANYIDVCMRAIKDGDTDAACAMDGIKAVLDGETAQFTLEYPCHSPLEKRWFTMTAVPLAEGGAVITHFNITNRKQAEETLRESETRFRALVTASSDVLYNMSPHWHQMRFISGGNFLAETENSSSDWIETYIPPEDRQHVLTTIDEAVRTKSIFELEHRVRRVDGTLGWTFSRAVPLLDDKGEITEWFGAAGDITDHKKAEEALRLSEEKYRSLFNTMSEGFSLHEIICNEDGKPCDYRYLEVNAAFERLTGLKSDDLIGKRVREVLSEIEDYWVESFGKVALTGESAHLENYSAALDRWYEVFAYQPEPGRFAAVFTDITERKQAEKAILAAKFDAENNNRRLEAIMQALPVALVITDTKGGIILANDIDRKIWGQRPSTKEVADYNEYKAWWIDTGEAVKPHEWASTQAIWHAKTVLGQHLEIERFDGTHRYVINSAAPMRNADGEIIGSVVTIQDITDLVYAERALKKLNETLEQQVEERTGRLRQQAVKLRALATQLSIAERTERLRLAKILHDHIQQLIVGARMQVGQMKHDNNIDWLHKSAEEVNLILKEALDASRSLAIDLSPPILHEAGLIGGLSWLSERLLRNNKFTLDVIAHENAEPATEETKYLLFECARELAFNAVKHSGVSQAKVTLTRSQDGRIKLIVADGGKGFFPEMLKHRRADEVSFGLFSIQQRLEHIGGKFELKTEIDEGTTVTLTVPD